MSKSIQMEAAQDVAGGGLRYLRIWFYLVLITIGSFLFDLEIGLNLPMLFCFVTAVFGVQYFVSKHWRRHLHLAFSVGALFYFFGWMTSACVLLCVGALILLYLSKISFKFILSGFVLVLLMIAFVRITNAFGPIVPRIAGLIGVLLMFRVIIMLYDLYANGLRLSPLEAWNYFLMLPNYIFMIFPIIDTKLFVRSYREEFNIEVFEKGFLWILRGAYYLLLYRVIYFYLIPVQSEVVNISGFLLYCILNYLLIYRLIGIFYISTGVLCLLGYDLPKVFNNMFFSNSFNDLWRRLNVYWKDFILKVFYLPLYFRLRKKYGSPMLFIFILIFILNWFLHGYQWFWILGSFPIRDTDILFWLIFGVLVGLNAVVDQRTKGVNSEYNWLVEGMKVGGMLAFMCVFWTFWTSKSLDEFNEFVCRSGVLSLKSLVIFVGVYLFVGWICGLLKYLFTSIGVSNRYDVMSRPIQMNVSAGLLIFMLIIGSSPVKEYSNELYGDSVYGFYEEKLNKEDSENEFEGYYEELLAGTSFSAKLGSNNISKETVATDSSWTNLSKTNITMEVDGISEKALIPDQKIIFKGKELNTNEWGFRDRSNYYQKEKPDDVVRIAIVGGSIEMGAGVEDDETFENILEDTLNHLAGKRRVEVMNFAISGVHMPQHVGKVADVVSQWSVDYIFYFAHPNERYRALRSFAKVMYNDRVQDYPFLEEIRTNILDSIDGGDIRQMYHFIRPFKEQLYNWGLEKIDEYGGDMNAENFWIYVPTLGMEYNKEYLEMEKEVIARGYSVFNLSQAYANEDKKSLAIAPTDRHPNAKGHRLLFMDLFRLLEEKGYVSEWTK